MKKKKNCNKNKSVNKLQVKSSKPEGEKNPNSKQKWSKLPKQQQQYKSTELTRHRKLNIFKSYYNF